MWFTSKFRYNTTETWYKGNTHIHTPASDGGKTLAEIADMYASVSYDFLFCTDHWVASDIDYDSENYPLLWLDGIELDGPDDRRDYYHIVCLGAFTGISREMGLVAAMQAARAQGGILILAHPHWTGNSFEEALRWDFDGVEVYNHVCRWLNGKGDGNAYWSAMLERAPTTLAFAADDTHAKPTHPGWNGGWIVVNAPELSRHAMLDAIRAGNFYASTGPDFHTITGDEAHVTIHTSPIQFARLVGPGYRGRCVGNFEGEVFTEITFDIPQDWDYIYLEIEDTRGKRAWMNTLFTSQTF